MWEGKGSCGLRSLTAELFIRMGCRGVCERQEDPESTCCVRTWLQDKGEPRVDHTHPDHRDDGLATCLGISNDVSLLTLEDEHSSRHEPAGVSAGSLL